MVTPAVLKPGVRTSEFYVQVFTQVLAAVVALAAVFGRQVDPGPWQPVIGVIAVVASTLGGGWYAHARAKIKTAADPGRVSAPTTESIQCCTTKSVAQEPV